MRQGHFEEHWNDADGNPEGGVSDGRGFTISWQSGPLGRHHPECFDQSASGRKAMECVALCTRREPNGAFVEDVIQAVIGRIEFYELSRFACDSNKVALDFLRMAADALDSRTRDREARAVEGTHVA